VERGVEAVVCNPPQSTSTHKGYAYLSPPRRVPQGAPESLHLQEFIPRVFVVEEWGMYFVWCLLPPCHCPGSTMWPPNGKGRLRGPLSVIPRPFVSIGSWGHLEGVPG
jgi:hypothetical protein